MAANPMFLFQGMFPPGQKELNEEFKSSMLDMGAVAKNLTSATKDLKESLAEAKKSSADISSGIGGSGDSGEGTYNRGMKQVEVFDLVVTGIVKTIGALSALAAKAAEFETSLTQTSYRMLDPIGRMNSLYTQNSLLNARQQITSEGSTPWMSTSASEMVGYLDVFQQYGKLRNDTEGPESQNNLMELARIGGQGARERGFTRMEAAQTSMQYNVAGVDLNDLRGFNTELGKMARLGAMSKNQVKGIDQAILKLAYSFNMSGKEIESFGREYMKIAGVISLSGGDPNKILSKMNAYADGSKEGMLNALILGYDTKNPTQMMAATQGGAQQLLGMLDAVPDAMKAHVSQLMAPAMGLGGFDLKEIQQIAKTGSAGAKTTEKTLLAQIAKHTGETYVAHAEIAQKTLNDIEASAIRIGEGQLDMMVKGLKRFDNLIDKVLSMTEMLKDNPGKTALALAGVLALPAALRAFGPQLITGFGSKLSGSMSLLSKGLGNKLITLGRSLQKAGGFLGKVLGGNFAKGLKHLGANMVNGIGSKLLGLGRTILGGLFSIPNLIAGALGLGIVKVAKFFTSDKSEAENIKLAKESVARDRATILDIDAKLSDPRGLSPQKIKNLQRMRDTVVRNMAGEQATVDAGITSFKELFTGLKTDNEKLGDTLGTSDEDLRISDNVFSARDREYSGRSFLPTDVVAFRRSVMKNIENEGFEITETDRYTKHAPDSLHYKGRAIDFRAKDRIDSVKGQTELAQMIKDLKAQGLNATLELKNARKLSKELDGLYSINSAASEDHVHVSWGRDKVGALQGAEDQGVSSALEKAWQAGGIKGAPMVESKNGRIVVRQRPPSAAMGAAEEATTDMVSTMGTPGGEAVEGAGEEQEQFVFDRKVHQVLTTILQEMQGKKGSYSNGPTIRAGARDSTNRISGGVQMRPSVTERF
jgi:hypothetical protein